MSQSHMSPPAAWDGLRKAFAALPPERIQQAIVVKLQFQPTAEQYQFLHRVLELASTPRKDNP